MAYKSTIIGYDSKEQAVSLLMVLVGMRTILFPFNKRPRVAARPTIGTSPCARDAKGRSCSPLSTRARRFTLLGAWEKALFECGLKYTDEYVVKAEYVFLDHVEPFSSLAEWQGVADEDWVRLVLDCAIADGRETASEHKMRQLTIGLNSQGELKTRMVEVSQQC